MSPSPARVLGIALGTVAILGIGVYTPAMLLGPLPSVTVDAATAPAAAPASTAVALPADDASAVALLADDGSLRPVASSADDETGPIGGAAKLVTVLAVLDGLPLEPGEDGPKIRIGAEDFTDYLRYSEEGSRTLQVSPGDSWSERDVVRAVLTASSNNHADTLARWAFGSLDAYVARANAWLEEQGFTETRVADTTGLSGDNVGTAAELTRLAALVLANPELATMLEGESGSSTPTDDRRVPDVVAHLADDGIRAISRSYTDEALITFVWASDVTTADGRMTMVGAMTGVDDYETLDAAVLTAVEGMAAASTATEVIAQGAVYGQVRAAWGDRADLVASAGRSGDAAGASVGDAVVDVEPFSTSPAGRSVGTVTVQVGEREVTSFLELDRAIADPGPLWRLTHPGQLVGAFLDPEA
ncbi:serine hydrolase [Agromyces sp. SYSU T0242]|uniref:serine hydrolase n=1 Tax=Agromyces litoreus TaxID=3158561 RepID=UPI0033964CD3